MVTNSSYISTNKNYRHAERDIISAHHKFLWDQNNTSVDSLEKRLAKDYHDQLYKDYCIGDLTHYKGKQIALRWRTKKEVISGKGESICGNKKCISTEELKSWEVNFNYVDDGKSVNALVKLRLCKNCSIILNGNKKKHKSDGKNSSETKVHIKEECESDHKESSVQNVEKDDNKKANPDNLWDLKDSESTDMTRDDKIEMYLLDIL